MRILITGALGQLGTAMQSALSEHELTLVDLPDIDITRRAAIFASFSKALPDVVIHCAALTDVDGCAKDPALAYKINGLGTQNVALACQQYNADMVHISTNEVFSGENQAGYEEWMPLSPRNSYGRSKAAAETHVRNILTRFYVVRLAWLFAPGGRNFVHAILDRASRDAEVRVVVDEVGNPTYVKDLASAIGQLIQTQQYGIYHFTNAGACSRWEFANEILRIAGMKDVRNIPILSREYRRPSTPPAYAILHNVAGAAIGIELRPWQDALAEYIHEYETDLPESSVV